MNHFFEWRSDLGKPDSNVKTMNSKKAIFSFDNGLEYAFNRWLGPLVHFFILKKAKNMYVLNFHVYFSFFWGGGIKLFF